MGLDERGCASLGAIERFTACLITTVFAIINSPS